MRYQYEIALNRARRDWEEANARLVHYDRLLMSALEMYSTGEAPMPLELMTEVQSKREECNKLFEVLMRALHDDIERRR